MTRKELEKGKALVKQIDELEVEMGLLDQKNPREYVYRAWTSLSPEQRNFVRDDVEDTLEHKLKYLKKDFNVL